MIENYHFGSITIDGKTYNNDVILIGNDVIDWWRDEGHYVAVQDLKDLPDGFDFLVIGNGASGCCKVSDKVEDFCKEKEAELIVEMTGDAQKTFNQLLAEGKKVVGAFHLTC
jgi:hypothetical protein